MSKKVDYTLYNQIKEKFPAQPNVFLFVSITSDNVDDLVAQPFTTATSSELSLLVNEHWNEHKPYAGIGGFGPKYVTFLFVCEEFLQEEDYRSGKILEFNPKGFKMIEYDVEKVRDDLAKLSKLLFGNSKAS